MAIGPSGGGAPGGRPRPRGPAPALDRNQLAARLRAIADEVPSPEEALEPMVRVVLEATGAGAGALCLYDVHHRLLRLTAEVGLSDEGCQKLRLVKQGSASSWDMPLHGLLNRRAYLIENAASNRFVPPLVEDTAAMNAVACLPLYDGNTPLASFILIALAPHTLAEGHLHAVEGPLAEMGRVIETIRQRAQGRSEAAARLASASATPAAPPPAATAAAPKPAVTTPPLPPDAAPELARLAEALAHVEGERDELGAALEAARAETARAQARVEALAAVEDEHSRLTQALATAETERAEQARLAAAAATHDRHTQGGELQMALDATRSAEEARDRAIAELATLQAELTSAHTTAEELTQEITRHHVEHERLSAHVVELRTSRDEIDVALADARRQSNDTATRLTEAQRALEHIHEERTAALELAETRLAEREADLQALRDERAGNVESLTARAEALAADADRLRTDNTALTTARDRLTGELADAHRRYAQFEETAQHAAATARARAEEDTAHRTAAEEATAALRAHGDAATTRLGALEQALAEARRQHESDAAGARAQEAALAEARRHVDTVTTALAEARRQVDTVTAELAARDRAVTETRKDAETRAATLVERERELAELRRHAEAVATRARTLESERDGLDARTEESAAQIAERDQMLAETRERADTATARVVALEHERDALRVAHAAETAALQDEIAALTTECQQLRDDAPTSVAVPADGGLDDEDVEPAAADADPGDAPTFEPCPQLIVVLDHEAAWQDVSVDKYDLLVVAPGDDIVTRLAPTWPGRILANLAVPGTLKTLLALRATGAPTRMWGCIANGAGDHALPLGAIEPAARPLAPDAVLAALAAHLPAGGRVVTVGADVDALLSLRQALARQGMSVSLAWDAKQANELLEMVHPDVVVTDLGAPDDAYTVIAHLAASDPIPTAVLIDGASDVAAGFAAILGAPAIKHRLTSRQQLLGGIVGGPVRKPAGPARPAARPRL